MDASPPSRLNIANPAGGGGGRIGSGAHYAVRANSTHVVHPTRAALASAYTTHECCCSVAFQWLGASSQKKNNGSHSTANQHMCSLTQDPKMGCKTSTVRRISVNVSNCLLPQVEDS